MRALDRAVAIAKGQAKLAQVCGVATSAVAMWKFRKSVPPEYCARIEKASGVMRWELRPNDWHLIWPELRRKKGAPSLSEAD